MQPMQPKADMVLKECGYMDSMTSSAMARDGELIQTQYFFHHGVTICQPNSSYVIRNVGCNNNVILQKIVIFMSPTVDGCRTR